MVAIFTGLGAGFERGSAAQIGSAGLLGGGVQGRGGDRISVNAATGNLLINRQDEFLVGRGPDVGVSRTYNSLGALDENGDHWRQSTDRRLQNLVGTAGTDGSQITRVSADGSEITYTFSDGAYRTTEGAGAHDTITYGSSGWFTWKDGDSGITELYGNPAGQSYWSLGYIEDQDGNRVNYTWSNGKLDKVTTADGGYLKYTWSGNNITSIETYANGGSNRTHIRTGYVYDSLNRLVKVVTDLNLTDNDVINTAAPNPAHVNGSLLAGAAKAYTTSYSYHGSADRIATITQTDGSQVNFTYDGSGRVYDITQILGNGEPNRITKVRYNSGHTEVYDPSGTRTSLYYDTEKQLTQIRTATPGVDTYTHFTYDGAGNLSSVKDAEENTTLYDYDERGNVIGVTDPLGNQTTREYDLNNNLVREIIGGQRDPINLVTSDSAADLLASFSAHNGYNGANYTKAVETVDGREAVVLDAQGGFHEYSNGLLLGGYHTIRQGDLSNGYYYSVQEGEQITFGFEAKEMVDLSGSGKIRLLAYFYNEDGTYVGGDSLYVTEGQEWTSVSKSMLAPEDAVKVLFNVYIYGRDANTTGEPEPAQYKAAVRNFHLTREVAPATEVLSGGLPANADDFLYATTDWGGGATVDVQTIDGAQALVFDDTGFTGAGWDHGSSHWVSGGDLNGGNHYSVEAGDQLALSLEAKRLAGDTGVGILYAYFYDIDGNYITSTHTYTTDNAEWKQSTRNFEAPEGAAYYQVRLIHYGDRTSGVTEDHSKVAIRNISIQNLGKAHHYGHLSSNLVTTDSAADLLASFSAHNGYNGANYTKAVETVDGREAVVLDAQGGFHEYSNGLLLGGYHTIRQGDLSNGYYYSVQEGEQITFGFEAKEMVDLSGSGKIRLLAYFYNEDGTYVGGDSLYVTEGQEWTSVSKSMLAPEDAVKVLFNVYIYGRDANTTGEPEPAQYKAAVRNFHLTREVAPATEVLSGGLPANADDFLYATTDWGGGATVDVQTIDGAQALVFDDTGFTGAGWDHGSSHWVSGGDLNGGNHYSVEAGDQLALSLEAKRLAGDTGVGILYAYFYDIDGNYITSTHTYTTDNAEWKQSTRNFEAPEGAAYYQVRLIHYGDRTSGVTEDHSKVAIRNISIQNLGKVQGYLAPNSAASTAENTIQTRFIYDSESHLRYAIDGNGGVTEYEYDALGNLRFTKEYTDQTYDQSGGLPNEAALNAWRDGFDRTHTQIFEHRYDAKGNVRETVDWGGSSPTGTTAGIGAEGYTHRVYTHDSAGRLLSQHTVNQETEYFTYDGLGRMISTTDLNGGTTSIVFNDAATQTVITSAGDEVTTSTYNKAGGLISQTRSALAGSYDVGGTSNYKYDNNGRLRMMTNALGHNIYYVYDKVGNLTAEVDHIGFVKEYRYDKNGRQTASARYTNYKDTADRAAMLVTLADPNNTLTSQDLLKGGTHAANHHAYDIWQWTAYDAKGQVSRTVLGDGSVTSYEYDKAGRLIKTYSYANKLSSGELTNLRNGTAEADAYLPSIDAAKDQINRTFYDRARQVIGTLNGDGYLTQTTYDSAGKIVQESVYAGLTASSLRASGTFSQLLNSVTQSTQDAHSHYVYDGQGHLRFAVDPLGQVTETVYGHWSGAYVPRATIQHSTPLGSLSDYKLNTVKGVVAAVANTATERKSHAVYNTKGQLVYSIDATSAVTRYEYDIQGNVTKTTQYAFEATNIAPTEAALHSWATTANSADARINRNYYSDSGLLIFTVDAEGYVTRFYYDAEDRQTYTYSFANKVTATDSWTLYNVDAANKGASTFTWKVYDHEGQLSYFQDANGVLNHYAYYANEEQAWDIRAINTADESRVLYVNDAAGRLLYKYHYNGDTPTEKYRYDAHYYDGLGNLTRVSSNRGTQDYAIAQQNTYFTHDKQGNVLTQTNAEGGITRFEYNAFGQVTKATDPKGYVTTNTYDKGGRLTRTTDALNYHTDFTYTAFNEQATVKRNNATTTFAYDKLGQVTRVTDALGGYEAYTYTAFGQQASVRNKLGGYSYNTYDKRGQMTQSRIAAPGGQLVHADIINKYEYDSRGNQTKMIEAFGQPEVRTTIYVYDKVDQLIQKKGDVVSIYTSGADSSAANVTPTEYYSYDRRGNLIESKDANGARTLYYYDRMDRVTHQISPEGTLVRNFYDANSNLKETRVYANDVSLPGNALGNPPADPSNSYRRTTFEYDRLNRMTDSYVHDVQTAKLGSTFTVTRTDNVLHTQYEYDANGNVIKVIDPNGEDTRSEYDKLNRKTRQYDAGNFRTDWAYNADGNVTRETRFGTGADPHRITEFGYNKNGQRVLEVRRDVLTFNGSGASLATVTGQGGNYNVSGIANTVKIEQGDSDIQYLYNALGQVTRKTEANADYIHYTYDNQGRLIHEVRKGYTDHNGVGVAPRVHYYYNGLNDVQRVLKYGTTWSETAAQTNNEALHTYTFYTYAKGGRLTSVKDANGFLRTYRYDAKGQMVREEYVRVTNGASQTEGIGYDFDKEGRVIAQGAVVKSGSTWSRGGAALDTVNTKYNAFGDVSERGINGKYSEKMDYDNAGRLWRTTSGDGAYKYFMYDNNGNQSLVVTSAGRNIDNKSIAQILAIWGVSTADANNNNIVDYADRVRTDYESNITATLTEYDARNLAIEVREPHREYHNAAGTKTTAEFITKRGYNAFGEVISETDANNKTITYTYNTMGRRTKVVSPQIAIANTSNPLAPTLTNPTEYYYYDISGRLVASKDANGNLTKQTLLAGTGYNGTQALITKTTAADGGTVTTAYDIQGNARKITDQLGRVTTNSFDKMGNLTQINHASGLIDSYNYDGLGQQIKHYNNVAVTNSYYDKLTGTTIPGGPDFASTDYDAQGRIVVQRAIGGDITATSYSFSGTGVLAAHGGWLQTTTLANGLQSKVYKNVFDQAIRSYDLGPNGGRQVNYTYDKGGRLTQASGVGLDTQTYHYLNTSKLDKLVISGAVYGNHNVSRTTDYGYDKTGNLTSEKFTQTTTVHHNDDYYEDYDEAVDYDDYQGTYSEFLAENGLTPGTYTTVTSITLQNARATYDALGRIKSWNELGTVAASGFTTKVPAASKVFEYDAQGNIRRTTSTYKSLDAQGVASATATTKDTWYKFDAMNRVVTAEGQLVGGQVVRGSQGVDIVYDTAGQRKYTLKDAVTTNYTKSGGYTTTTTTTRESYTYNTGGQVTQVNVSTATNGATPSATGTRRSTMVYDAMGRQTRQLDYEANGTTIAFDSTKTYNNKSQITNDTSITKRSDGTFKGVTTYNYGAGASYALGAANTVTTANYKNNSHENTSRTTNTYAYYNGAVQTRTTFDGNISSSSDRIATTYYTNSKSGVLLSARVADGRARTVTFTVDNQGQTIRRDERDYKAGGDPHEIWYRYGGKEMGYVGNNGTYNTGFAQSITDRTTTPTTGTNAGAFKHGRTTGTSHADFDQAYQAINSYKQGSSSGTYTVRSGDTLQAIAANIYGDSSLWYKIAAANGMTGEAALIEGQSLNLPSGVVKSSHNASTFKPYSPGDIQGDLNPTTPLPQNAQKGKKCGGIGAIIVAVVAVVVVAVVAPYLAAGLTSVFSGGSFAAGVTAASAAGATAVGTSAAAAAAAAGSGFAATAGAIAGGAIAGAVGSIASQAVGVSLGIQEKFSWKGVALAAIGGGVGGGVGRIGGLNTAAEGLNNAQRIFRGATSGALSSAISQGIGVATGLQDSFSFAGVAAAGVSGGVSAGLSGAIGDFAHGLSGNQKIAGAIAGALQGGAAAIANAATRSAIEGTSFGDNIIAAIPDVVAQAVSGYISACFVGGTMVHTPTGLKRIDEIKVGDWVYSRDEHFNNEDIHRKRVIKLFHFENRKTLDVTISLADGTETTLRTTSGHPFAVIENRILELSGYGLEEKTINATEVFAWRSAGDLLVGDRTVDIQGREGLVTALTPVDELLTVHNFAVEDDHTYFVSDQGVWVHNQCQDAIEESQENPVEKEYDINDYIIVDAEGNAHLFMPGVVGFDGKWAIEPSTIALGSHNAISDDEALARFNLLQANPLTRDATNVGMVARGGKDAVVGIGGLISSSFDASLFSYFFRREAFDTQWGAIGNGLKGAGNAVSDRYFNENWLDQIAMDSFYLKYQAGGDLINWAGGQVRQDQIDIGRASYESEFNLFNPLNGLTSGYSGGDFIGAIGFEALLTVGTLGASNITKARYVSYLDDVGSVANVSEDFVTLYRGDRPGTSVFKSYAARERGYAGSQSIIDAGDLDNLFSLHAIDSSMPPSPFISLTSDIRVAQHFAGAGGEVFQFRMPRSRAHFNPHNSYSVEFSPGQFIPETEYLVPNYIRPSEIVK